MRKLAGGLVFMHLIFVRHGDLAFLLRKKADEFSCENSRQV